MLGKHRLNFYGRMVASYLIIALMAVIALFVVLYNLNVGALKRELDGVRAARLRAATQGIDVRLLECQNIAWQISTNPLLSHASLTSNGSRILSGKTELNKYSVGNSYISDIYICFYQEDVTDNVLYSMRGLSSMDSLLYYFLGFPQRDALRFKESLSSLAAPRLVYFEGADMLAYLIPPPPSYAADNGIILFLLSGSTIREFAGIPEQDEALFLFDKAGTLLFHSLNLGADERFARQVCAGWEQGRRDIRYEGVRYTLYVQERALSGGVGILALPARFTSSPLFGRFLLTVGAGALGAGIIVSLCFHLARRTARPIRRLRSLVSECGADPAADGNDLEYISNMVCETLDRNRKLLTLVDIQKDDLRQSFFTLLLRGDANDEREAQRQLEGLGIAPAGRYCVVCVQRANADNADAVNAASGELAPALWTYRELRVCAAAAQQAQMEVYVIFLPEGGARALLEDFCANLLQQSLPGGATGVEAIGVGRAYSALTEISRSYREAGGVIGYLEPEQPSILFFEDALEKEGAPDTAAENEVLLLHALRQGDGALVRRHLDALLTDMHRHSASPGMLKYRCCRLLDFLLRVLPGEAGPEGFASLTLLLESLETLPFGAFRRRIMEFAEEVCMGVREENEKKDGKLKEHILNYVAANFCSPSISLDLLVDQFGYSIYYWSRFFKETIGMNFTEYLWKLRLEEFKRLLTSGRPIAEIAQQVGYLDANSFARKFKTAEGITPGQYRKIYCCDSVIQVDHQNM